MKTVGDLPDRRLPEEQREQREERDHERDGGEVAVEERPLGREASTSLGAGAEHDARIEVDLAPDEPAVDPGVGAGVDDRVEAIARRVRDRHEHDVRLVPLRGAAASSCVPPSDRHAVDAPAAQARVVVDEADDALAGRLAQLAHQAAAGASGADDQRASPGPVAVASAAPRDERRARPSREAPISDRAEQRVDDEERAREVAESTCVSAMYAKATSSETDDRERDRARSRAPA